MTLELAETLQKEQNEKTGKILRFPKGTPTYTLSLTYANAIIGGYSTIADYKKDGGSLGKDYEIEETSFMKRTGLVNILVDEFRGDLSVQVSKTVALKDAKCYKLRKYIIPGIIILAIVGFIIYKRKK